MALDLLISAQVVVANGSVVTASENENQELFWALRGAGSSYGIVTSLEFQTFPAPTNNVVFSTNFFWNQTQARNAFAILQNYANTTMSKPMNLRLYVTPFDFSILGVYYGSQDDLEAELTPLLAQLGTPFGTNIATMGWLDALSNYAYSSLTIPFDYNVVSRRFTLLDYGVLY